MSSIDLILNVKGNLDFALLSNHINFSHRSIYAFSEVAKAIARLIALALDLGATFFDQQEMLGKPIAMFRLLHCEGLISDPTKGLYGAVAHSNFGLVTLLATDDVVGLQICKHKDVKPQIWEHVAPLKGWVSIALRLLIVEKKMSYTQAIEVVFVRQCNSCILLVIYTGIILDFFYIDGLTTYAIELLGGRVGSNTYGRPHLANKWYQKHVGLFHCGLFIFPTSDIKGCPY
ncbi:unnamed protein product [Ilex paraguariensis]|uniref:Uncharacterized protein n=1 Tax=Ilex paraguariensis TaxID=185542 RepID=A0ABC8T0L4_9AQUA